MFVGRILRTGSRLAGRVVERAVDAGCTVAASSVDSLTLGRAAVRQVPGLIQLLKVMTESPEAVGLLLRETGRNAGMITEVTSLLRNPALQAFIRDVTENPERLNQLLKMGNAVSGMPLELAESTSRNAPILQKLLSLIERDEALASFMIDLAKNPGQLAKLQRAFNLDSQGSPIKALIALLK